MKIWYVFLLFVDKESVQWLKDFVWLMVDRAAFDQLQACDHVERTA